MPKVRFAPISDQIYGYIKTPAKKDAGGKTP